MSSAQFDLKSLMNLQFFYDPLTKVLEYLLERDKAISSSLIRIDQRLDSNDNKIVEVQTGLDITKANYNLMRELIDKHENEIEIMKKQIKALQEENQALKKLVDTSNPDQCILRKEDFESLMDRVKSLEDEVSTISESHEFLKEQDKENSSEIKILRNELFGSSNSHDMSNKETLLSKEKLEAIKSSDSYHKKTDNTPNVHGDKSSSKLKQSDIHDDKGFLDYKAKTDSELVGKIPLIENYLNTFYKYHNN